MALNYNAAVNITAQFQGQNAVNQAKSSFASLDATIGKVGTALKGLVGLYAAKQVAEYVKGVIDLGDHLNDLSQVTGLSVTTLDSLKGAAEENGIAFDQLETGLKKFTSNLTLHHKEFESIGITTKDVNTAFLQLAERFASLPTAADRAALSVKVFGKSGADLVRIIGLGSQALKGFGSGITDDFAKRADQFNDTLGAISRNAKASSVSIISNLLPGLQQIADAFSKFQKGGPKDSGFGSLLSYIVDLGKVVVGVIVSVGELAIEIADSIATTFKGVGTGIKDFIQSFFEDDQDKFADKAIKSQKKIADDWKKRLEDRFAVTKKFEDDLFKNFFDPDAQRKATKPKVKKVGGGTEDIGDFSEQLKKDADALARLGEEQNKAIELNGLEHAKLELSTAEYEKRKIAIEENAKAQKELLSLSPEIQDKYKEEVKLLIQIKQAAIDFQEQQKQSFGAGAQAAFKEYLESARDVAAQTKSLFLHAFQGLEDAIVEFVKRGKLSFASLADAIETDLIRIAVRQSLVAGLAGLGSIFAAGAAGGAGGVGSGGTAGPGFFTASSHGNIVGYSGAYSLKRYAAGGVAYQPQVSLFGEGSTPEAYVPLQDGRSIPVSLKGGFGKSGGDTSVVVHVNVSQESGDSDVTSNSEKGKQLGRLMGAAARQAILQEKRPGGLLSG